MNATALQPTGPVSPVPTVSAPMDIVRAALATGNVEMYREAVALAKELDAIAARKAFDAAMSDARAEIKPVVRNAKGHNGKYADFAAIARAIDPVIAKHGISYRFRAQQTEKLVTVTCIITHRAGHFEETTLTGPIDISGNKNPIQAIGSSMSYLQRYTLNAAMGLAASNDDDGNTAGGGADDYTPPPGSISPAQVEELRMALADTGKSERAFLQWAGVRRIEDLQAEIFDSCIEAITGKDKRQ